MQTTGVESEPLTTDSNKDYLENEEEESSQAPESEPEENADPQDNSDDESGINSKEMNNTVKLMGKIDNIIWEFDMVYQIWIWNSVFIEELLDFLFSKFEA